jgi:hypothetical protein
VHFFIATSAKTKSIARAISNIAPNGFSLSVTTKLDKSFNDIFIFHLRSKVRISFAGLLMSRNDNDGKLCVD